MQVAHIVAEHRLHYRIDPQARKTKQNIDVNKLLTMQSEPNFLNTQQNQSNVMSLAQLRQCSVWHCNLCRKYNYLMYLYIFNMPLYNVDPMFTIMHYES